MTNMSKMPAPLKSAMEVVICGVQAAGIVMARYSLEQLLRVAMTAR